MTVLHYTDGDPRTEAVACGRVRVTAPNVTTDPRHVTCRSCLRWLGHVEPAMTARHNAERLLEDTRTTPEATIPSPEQRPAEGQTEEAPVSSIEETGAEIAARQQARADRVTPELRAEYRARYPEVVRAEAILVANGMADSIPEPEGISAEQAQAILATARKEAIAEAEAAARRETLIPRLSRKDIREYTTLDNDLVIARRLEAGWLVTAHSADLGGTAAGMVVHINGFAHRSWESAIDGQQHATLLDAMRAAVSLARQRADLAAFVRAAQIDPRVDELLLALRERFGAVSPMDLVFVATSVGIALTKDQASLSIDAQTKREGLDR